jgi:hypothetical protein
MRRLASPSRMNFSIMRFIDRSSRALRACRDDRASDVDEDLWVEIEQKIDVHIGVGVGVDIFGFEVRQHFLSF